MNTKQSAKQNAKFGTFLEAKLFKQSSGIFCNFDTELTFFQRGYDFIEVLIMN